MFKFIVKLFNKIMTIYGQIEDWVIKNALD